MGARFQRIVLKLSGEILAVEDRHGIDEGVMATLAAELRAIEIGADVILKATKVDGVYSGDPAHDASATFFPRITYLDILTRGLKVMDSTAISLCMENRLPLVVFNVGERGNLLRVVRGEEVGTLVGERDS